MTSWSDRRAEVARADGEQWDTLHARLKRDWQSEFVRAFVAFAVSRRWQEAHARDWADILEDEAFLDGDADPVVEAHLQVRACECEAAE